MTSLITTGLAGLGALYMWHVNSAMKVVPEEAQKLSPHRWTVEEIKAAYKKSLETPIDVTKSLPPKQSRRYVIVGGTGLIGAWIVSHLLTRGEDPKAIRILDLMSPEQDILNKGVRWTKTNITDKLAPCPTVYHTAAIIRPQDRLKSFLPLSSKVNIDGTRNVLNAARAAGATAFIWTSSGSIALHQPTFWIAPWATQPKRVVQVISDSTKLPESHYEFFGNYAVTKSEAELLVRAADNPATNFRTGCIRPTNGVYGTGGQANNVITGLYLRNGGSPTWARPMLQSFVHAENVSIAHLLYEQRLIQQSEPGSQLPNTGGQAFTVSDPNPAIAFDDLYTLLTTLSSTPLSFPEVQPLPLLVVAYFVEMYTFLQYRYLSWFLPRLSGDIGQLQPSLFSIINVHVFADDSRAKLAPEMGGLGYNPPLNTLEGLCRRLVDWNTKAEGEGVAVMGKKIRLGPVKVAEDGVDVAMPRVL
ncbi:3-beta hydroxysteroid dehydrogenase/isomerase [Penicillium expansum]|nr:3-beta hydroxysteroid dehydrogenase/isomerase [Penicillium expansum]